MKKLSLLIALLLFSTFGFSQTLNFINNTDSTFWSLTVVMNKNNTKKSVIVLNSTHHSEPEVLNEVLDTVVNGYEATKLRRADNSFLYVLANDSNGTAVTVYDPKTKASIFLESDVVKVVNYYKSKYEKSSSSRSSNFLDSSTLLALFKFFLL